MTLHFTNLSITGFRAIKSLSLEQLGRVNLITGFNNTGKSTTLEALRILASDASIVVIRNILRNREEDSDGVRKGSGDSELEDLFGMTSLFWGYPQLQDRDGDITIRADGGKITLSLKLSIELMKEERFEGGRRLVRPEQYLFGEDVFIPTLAVKSNGSSRHQRLDITRPSSFMANTEKPPLRCIFESPFGGESTEKLGTLWDNIALSSLEVEVVKSLQIIDSQIMAVTMVGGESNRRRTAIVRSSAFPRPVPLRSFGDGLNRLFGIILSLVNAQNGLLLIDEFENGMHYSVQKDTWTVIFAMAKKLNIQVFATTHSWDAISAFQIAAAATPEDGVLVRLTRKGSDLIPTVFQEDELAIVTRDEIEVR